MNEEEMLIDIRRYLEEFDVTIWSDVIKRTLLIGAATVRASDRYATASPLLRLRLLTPNTGGRPPVPSRRRRLHPISSSSGGVHEAFSTPSFGSTFHPTSSSSRRTREVATSSGETPQMTSSGTSERPSPPRRQTFIPFAVPTDSSRRRAAATASARPRFRECLVGPEGRPLVSAPPHAPPRVPSPSRFASLRRDWSPAVRARWEGGESLSLRAHDLAMRHKLRPFVAARLARAGGAPPMEEVIKDSSWAKSYEFRQSSPSQGSKEKVA